MPRRPHPRTALSGYADARLPAWRHVLVGAHVARCTRCAVEVGQIRALGRLLRSSGPEPVAPGDLVDRLLAIGVPEPVVPEPVPPVLFVPVRRAPDEAHVRPSVGAAGALVAAVVMVGTVGAGAVVTGVPVPWPSATTRASLATVLVPRLPSGLGEPDAAVSVRAVDNAVRP